MACNAARVSGPPSIVRMCTLVLGRRMACHGFEARRSAQGCSSRFTCVEACALAHAGSK